MWSRVEFKQRGKDAIRRNYGSAVAVTFVMGLISMILNGNSSASGVGESVQVQIENFMNSGHRYEYYFPIDEFGSMGVSMLMSLLGLFFAVVSIALILLKIFVEYNLKVGGAKFFVQNQTSKPGVDTLLDGFRSGHYGNIVVNMLLRDVFIGLWTLLFVIPGIVKSYEYRMIPYILAENPGMKREDVFQISKEMMRGHKFDLFMLDLSFIGWNILAAMTCGLLGIFFVNPYVEATNAEVYTYNKQKAFDKGYIR